MMHQRDRDEESRHGSRRAARKAGRVAVTKAEDGGSLLLPAALFGAFAVALLLDTAISLISG